MDALGISAANFVVQLIAFILFVIIFWKFALGPITGMLDARQATIRESLEEAERVRREMAAAEARNEEILLEARREAQQILANAREPARASRLSARPTRSSLRPRTSFRPRSARRGSTCAAKWLTWPSRLPRASCAPTSTAMPRRA